MKPATGVGTVFLDPAGGFDFGRSADFADHDDAMGLGIGLEHLDHIQVGGAVHRIAADTNAGALADALGRQLEDRLVGEGPGTGNHADIALFVDIAGSDADPASAVRNSYRFRG